MSFKFNFPDPDVIESCEDKEEEAVTFTIDDQRDEDTSEKTCLAPAHEIKVNEGHRDFLKGMKAIEYTFAHGVTLHCVDSAEASKKLCSSREETSAIRKAVEANSDLLPMVYEGGLTVWECSQDLVTFLIQAEVELHGKNILELGCGAGLPGIYCATRGANVTFQDYNLEVLNNYTLPNVLLNKTADSKSCRFISGDWSMVGYFLNQHRFDIILAAETIYNTDYYCKLVAVFDRLLHENGVIYVAAKSYYFGLSGSVKLFEDYVNQKKIFHTTRCHTIEADIPRIILKLWR